MLEELITFLLRVRDLMSDDMINSGEDLFETSAWIGDFSFWMKGRKFPCLPFSLVFVCLLLK